MSSEETDPRSIHERIAALRRRMDAEGSNDLPPVPVPPLAEQGYRGSDIETGMLPPPIPAPEDSAFGPVPPIPIDPAPPKNHQGPGTEPTHPAIPRIVTGQAKAPPIPVPIPPVASAAADHSFAETKSSPPPPAPVSPAATKPNPAPQTHSASPPPNTPRAKRSAKPFLIAGAAAVFLGLGAWWFLDLRHRHTLTATERSQAEGWFAEVRAKEGWVMLPLPGAEVPMFGFKIATPVVNANEYGMVTINLAVTVEAHASELEYGRFNTSYQLNYTELKQPTELKLCRDASEGSHLCLTWRIINPDSMHVRIDLGERSEEYAVVHFARYVQLAEMDERREQMALIHAVDSIGQGVGMVRKGAFMAYMCGDECGAMFTEQRGGQPQQVIYVCNTNRFGDIQLSQGDMLGEGDFTNRELQGHRFLIVSKAVAMPDGQQAWVVLGLLRDELIRSFPELEQRLALAANFDDMNTSGTEGIPVSTAHVPQRSFLGGSATGGSTGQYGSTETDHGEIYTIVEDMPSFPGGETELFKYLGRSIRYPQKAQDADISGVVYVTFVVGKDGKISDAKVLRGIGGGCVEEALRVVRAMPNWKAGKQRGESVSVQYNMPIRFTLR